MSGVLGPILGLLGLMALAYLASHPRARRIEKRLGLQSAITSGLPFVAIGLVASSPRVGLLTPEVLQALEPLLDFGLGWLGFALGFKFDLRELDKLERRATAIVALETLGPFLAIALACGAVLLALGQTWENAAFLRDGLILATAGAMTSPAACRLVVSTSRGCNRELPPLLGRLDEVGGVIGLAILAAFFRPAAGEQLWHLPGAVWLFLALGLGTAVGMILYVLLRRPLRPPERMAVFLGAVAYAAGLAAFISLSPLAIGFLAGALVTNLPSEHRVPLGETLDRLERPIQLIFLAVVGALWEVADWRGWILMLAFAASRFLGLWAGSWAARADPRGGQDSNWRASLLSSPLSGLAIAVVINGQTLYHSQTVRWAVTAVVGGALVSEVLSQFGRRRRPPGSDAPASPGAEPPEGDSFHSSAEPTSFAYPPERHGAARSSFGCDGDAS
jgi:Kef-type K+ transport system membrane component KefB